MRYILLLIVSALVMINVAQASAPKFTAFGPYHYQGKSSDIPAAKQFFDQGMLLFWGDHHREAIRSFRAAIDTDPSCGICYFALSISLTAKQDMIFKGDERERAMAFLELGLEHEKKSTLHREMLASLVNRFYLGEKQTTTPFELRNQSIISDNELVTYINSLKELRKKYPNDLELKMWLAHSLYEKSNEKFWDQQFATEDTQTMFDLLNQVIDSQPNHPGAQHLLIKMIMTSSNPEEAITYAENLTMHFPNIPQFAYTAGQLFFILGDYHKATDLNQQALAALSRYQQLCQNQYHRMLTHLNELLYQQALSISATLEGRYKIAKKATRRLIKLTPNFLTEQLPALEWYQAADMLVETHFDHWQKVLNYPEPESPYLKTIWYYNAMRAFLANNYKDQAENAYKNMTGIIAKHSAELLPFQKNQVNAMQAISRAMLAENTASVQNDTDYWKQALTTASTATINAYYPFWHVTSYMGLANNMLHKGKIDKHIEVLNNAIDRYPNHPFILRKLAEGYALNKEKLKSTELYKTLANKLRFADELLANV